MLRQAGGWEWWADAGLGKTPAPAAGPSHRPLQVRYVIDFYSGTPQPGAAASMHLDVRPALDSLEAVVDRLRMQLRFVTSGDFARGK